MTVNPRTARAVYQQIQGMGLDSFELGLHHPEKGMILRPWNRLALETALPWLRYMNATGHHIYIRPTASLGLVLLDDLDHCAIARLSRDGLAPAAIVETSPANYQCWLRLVVNRERKTISPKLIRAVCLGLAETYGGDPNSADWRHFGRLAGFTNRKPCHWRAGRYPFVLLREATGAVAVEGHAWLLRAKRRLAQEGRARGKTEVAAPRISVVTRGTGSYRQFLDHLLAVNASKAWASAPDWSRVDFMVARAMLGSGQQPEAVMAALRSGSPGIESRKKGHLEDYLNRTVNKALAALPFSRQRPTAW